jgi:hypothetical protein
MFCTIDDQCRRAIRRAAGHGGGGPKVTETLRLIDRNAAGSHCSKLTEGLYYDVIAGDLPFGRVAVIDDNRKTAMVFRNAFKEVG